MELLLQALVLVDVDPLGGPVPEHVCQHCAASVSECLLPCGVACPKPAGVPPRGRASGTSALSRCAPSTGASVLGRCAPDPPLCGGRSPPHPRCAPVGRRGGARGAPGRRITPAG